MTKVIQRFLALQTQNLKILVHNPNDNISGHLPDFCLIVVGSNAGMIGMAKEHLGLALALNLPVMCVVTKIDMTPPNVMKETLSVLGKLLRSSGVRKLPLLVQEHKHAGKYFI